MSLQALYDKGVSRWKIGDSGYSVRYKGIDLGRIWKRTTGWEWMSMREIRTGMERDPDSATLALVKNELQEDGEWYW